MNKSLNVILPYFNKYNYVDVFCNTPWNCWVIKHFVGVSCDTPYNMTNLNGVL